MQKGDSRLMRNSRKRNDHRRDRNRRDDQASLTHGISARLVVDDDRCADDADDAEEAEEQPAEHGFRAMFEEDVLGGEEAQGEEDELRD